MITQSTILVSAFLAILTFVVPKKYFLVPFLAAVCFVPTDQRIIVMDLDFTVLRILVLAGVLRTWMRDKQKQVTWNKFDYMVFAWVGVGTLIYILQWSSMKAMINRAGVMFDVVGLYWLFRQRIRCREDIIFVFKILAVCALMLAPFVAFEWATGHNLFVHLGRVLTQVREGRYRCQAAFPHSLMLGLFWATVVPVFIGLGLSEQKKALYLAAGAASIFMIFSTASSTPVVVLAAVFLLLAFFPYRQHGRQIVFGICGVAIILHLLMNAPVWHLISRVDIVGGSTGWHRYNLIDKTIQHFGEWAILGTRSTAHWGRGLGDITNQYVLEGIRGGFITLIIFVALLVTAVKTIGRYSLLITSTKQQWFNWCICVSVLTHCISFMGVSYFGQISMLLYLDFAIVGLVYEISFAQIPAKTRPIGAAFSGT